MIWHGEWGPHFEFLQAMREMGKPVPALDERPALPAYATAYLVCYTDVSKESGIDWGDFYLWCVSHDVPSDEQEFMWDVINTAQRKIDKWHSDRAASKSHERQPSGVPRLPSSRGA